jgi:hypothetical protein
MLKIGFDFHGILDTYEIFRELTGILVSNGHEVHIITGEENTKSFRKTLKDLGIKYTKIFSITSYHKKKGTEVRYDKNDEPWMDKKIWNPTKANYCKRNNIYLHIDDSLEYGEHFKTPFIYIQPLTDNNSFWWKLYVGNTGYICTLGNDEESFLNMVLEIIKKKEIK